MIKIINLNNPVQIITPYGGELKDINGYKWLTFYEQVILEDADPVVPNDYYSTAGTIWVRDDVWGFMGGGYHNSQTSVTIVNLATGEVLYVEPSGETTATIFAAYQDKIIIGDSMTKTIKLLDRNTLQLVNTLNEVDVFGDDINWGYDRAIGVKDGYLYIRHNGKIFQFDNANLTNGVVVLDKSDEYNFVRNNVILDPNSYWIINVGRWGVTNNWHLLNGTHGYSNGPEAPNTYYSYTTPWIDGKFLHYTARTNWYTKAVYTFSISDKNGRLSWHSVINEPFGFEQATVEQWAGVYLTIDYPLPAGTIYTPYASDGDYDFYQFTWCDRYSSPKYVLRMKLQEEHSIIYAVNVDTKITAVLLKQYRSHIFGYKPAFNYLTLPQEHQAFDIYLSKDLNNWVKVADAGYVDGEWTGDVYIKLKWNPVYVYPPIFKDLIVVTAERVITRGRVLVQDNVNIIRKNGLKIIRRR